MKYNSKYWLGIAWFLLSLVISNSNDVLSKYLGSSMHPIQISFFRFLFCTLSLMPFMLYFGRSAFRTTRPLVHIMRGTGLFLAMSMWIYGLGLVPVVSATLMTFTVPIFVLIMARAFLGEQVGLRLWLATIVGFIGALIILEPSADQFNPLSFMMLISAALFALLDIINKKFIVKESMLPMLFYSALITTILASYPAYIYWHAPTVNDLILLAVLGVGGNLVLYCLLKAFMAVKASAVAPYRYLELVISGISGYFVFHELPGYYMLIGAAIIVPSTLYVAYSQSAT